MWREQFKVESYYDVVDPPIVVPIDGSGGETVSWRNIAGSPCSEVMVDNFLMYELLTDVPAAGIYNVKFTSSSTALVYAAYDTQFLSPKIDTTEIDVVVDDYNTHIIPGLVIKLGASISEDDKFQVIIGGFWFLDESRVVKSLIFNPMTSGTTPSKENTIKITNVSGYDIRNVKAVITHSASVKQFQKIVDLAEVVADRELTLWTPSHTDTTGEKIVRLTDDTTPVPYKVVASHTQFLRYNSGDSWYTYSSPYFPFSAIGGTLPTEFGWCRGWSVPTDSDLWTAETSQYFSIKEAGSVFIRYDFGKGNAVCFNRLGIASDLIDYFTLEASNDNSEFPTNWTPLLYWYDKVDSHCYDEYLGLGERYPMLVKYRNFMNHTAYRHWRIVPYNIYVLLSPPNPTDLRARIARLEFIDADSTLEITDRTRPFTVIDKLDDNNPTFVSNDVPYVIQCSNVTATTVDITIDGIGYDVIGVENKKTYPSGIELPFTAITGFQFSDLSPLSGLYFYPSWEIADGDYCEVYVGEGRNIFEIKTIDDSKWDRSATLTGSAALEAGIMEDNDYAYLHVRANPGIGVVGSDINAIDGTLFISGESDTEYDYSYTAKTYTVDTLGIMDGTIRQKIQDMDMAGDEIRFKFKAVGNIEISKVFFGMASPGTYDFLTNPDKVAITFGGLLPLSLTTGNEQWSDWAQFSTNNDDEFLISYEGTVIGNHPATDSGVKSAYRSANYSANSNTFSSYTEQGTNYDIVEIEVRNRLKVCKAIGLSSVVNQGVNNIELSVTLVPTEISDVLEDFGISWEEIS